MSKPELIVAYVSGRIGRRDFVRRLTALGVSATAAAAYAQTLAPGASAAGLGRTRSGLRVRGQEDYPGGDFGTDVEVVQTLLQVNQALESILAGIADLDVDALTLPDGSPLSDEDAEDLQTLISQVAAHRDALRTLLGDLGGDADEGTAPSLSYDQPEDALLDLQIAMEAQTGIYGAVIPQMTDQQTLSTLTSIALIAGRHAAFVNRLLGTTAFPETFQRAATPDETDELLSGLQG